MAIPLEDNFNDIIGKAQRGLGISDRQLAEKSGASVDAIRTVRDGKFDRATLDQIAPALQLDADALAELGQEKWRPNEIHIDGLAQFNTPYHDMMVNAYLVWDPASKEAVAFDSGADHPVASVAPRRRGSPHRGRLAGPGAPDGGLHPVAARAPLGDEPSLFGSELRVLRQHLVQHVSGHDA